MGERVFGLSDRGGKDAESGQGEKQEIVGSTCALIGSSSAIAIRARGAGGCISYG